MRLPRTLAALCCLGFVGCASAVPFSPKLALEGPPLAIALDWPAVAGGVMDRSSMAGLGTITLYDEATIPLCRGGVNSPPTQTGRMYAKLTCRDGSSLTLAYRNLGPDQGLGVGRVTRPDDSEGEEVVLFYHPSGEEARRRLVTVKDDLAKAREQRRTARGTTFP